MLKYYQKSNISDAVEREVDYIIKQGKTPYQEYVFFHSLANKTCIAINNDIQSCEIDEAIYHEALVHLAMIMHKNPKNVLIMGGGEGATAREVLKHHKVLDRVVMVDIDEEFVKVCKEVIPSWSEGVWENEKFEIIYTDINEYIKTTDIKFDVVIGDLVDVDDWDSFLANLYSNQFYKNLKNILNKGAILATQAGALSVSENINHKNIKKALNLVFKNTLSYAVTVPSFYGLWGFVLASDDGLHINYDKFQNEILPRFKDREIELNAIGNEELYSLFQIPKAIRKTYE